MDFLDIHTHNPAHQCCLFEIQSFCLSKDQPHLLPSDQAISVGLHPWYATLKDLPTQKKNLAAIAQNANVKMIGECGLDKTRGEKIENQIVILQEQILIAEAANKPLILHCVKAFAELVEIKERLKVTVPMIIHGFNKNEILGQQLISKGFLLSFGKAVMKKKSGASKLIQNIEDFLLETDDDDVSIEEIYEVAASLRNCSVHEIKELIFANWKKLNLI